MVWNARSKVQKATAKGIRLHRERSTRYRTQYASDKGRGNTETTINGGYLHPEPVPEGGNQMRKAMGRRAIQGRMGKPRRTGQIQYNGHRADHAIGHSSSYAHSSSAAAPIHAVVHPTVVLQYLEALRAEIGTQHLAFIHSTGSSALLLNEQQLVLQLLHCDWGSRSTQISHADSTVSGQTHADSAASCAATSLSHSSSLSALVTPLAHEAATMIHSLSKSDGGPEMQVDMYPHMQRVCARAWLTLLGDDGSQYGTAAAARARLLELLPEAAERTDMYRSRGAIQLLAQYRSVQSSNATVFLIVDAPALCTSLCLALAASNGSSFLSSIRAEIDASSNTVVHDDSLPSMLAARACSLEAVRLYPFDLLKGKKAPVNCEFDDAYVEKGEMLACSPYLLHRNDKLFEKPEAFLPSRWLNRDDANVDLLMPLVSSATELVLSRAIVTELVPVLVSAVASQFDVMYTSNSSYLIELEPLNKLRFSNGASMTLKRTARPVQLAAQRGSYVHSRGDPSELAEHETSDGHHSQFDVPTARSHVSNATGATTVLGGDLHKLLMENSYTQDEYEDVEDSDRNREEADTNLNGKYMDRSRDAHDSNLPSALSSNDATHDNAGAIKVDEIQADEDELAGDNVRSEAQESIAFASTVFSGTLESNSTTGCNDAEQCSVSDGVVSKATNTFSDAEKEQHVVAANHEGTTAANDNPKGGTSYTYGDKRRLLEQEQTSTSHMDSNPSESAHETGQSYNEGSQQAGAGSTNGLFQWIRRRLNVDRWQHADERHQEATTSSSTARISKEERAEGIGKHAGSVNQSNEASQSHSTSQKHDATRRQNPRLPDLWSGDKLNGNAVRLQSFPSVFSGASPSGAVRQRGAAAATSKEDNQGGLSVAVAERNEASVMNPYQLAGAMSSVQVPFESPMEASPAMPVHSEQATSEEQSKWNTDLSSNIPNTGRLNKGRIAIAVTSACSALALALSAIAYYVLNGPSTLPTFGRMKRFSSNVERVVPSGSVVVYKQQGATSTGKQLQNGLSGMQMQSEKAFARVASVERGSPGEQAGLKRGDKLIRAGNVGGPSVSQEQLASELSANKGAMLPLEIERHGERRVLLVSPCEWNGPQNGLIGTDVRML